ncbi:transporter substrate-binding domain-containing protein [Pseudodesulfovibrio indicus]|uniref:substrate-binding periplasmic protein n=1 Tax=Pseudodesulfovibrio indicus TaxID=1716143 RepID=UPI0029305FD7|nr:transporter substrate-binding domain-containing protein [Pseudodesulfovibrio indicus]
MAIPELLRCGDMENGKPVGYCVDIAEELAHEAGVETVITVRPLVRVLDDFQSGNVDLAVLVPDGALGDKARVLGEVLHMEFAAWARAETPLRDLRDLEGKPVAVVRGGQFKTMAGELKIVPIPTRNYDMSLKLLMVRRVDAVVGPIGPMSEALKGLGLDRNALGRMLPLGSLPLHFIVSDSLDPDVADRLKGALQHLRDDGTLDQIMEKYKL